MCRQKRRHPRITERTLFSHGVWLPVSQRRHVCCMTQQTCLLCDTADVSVVRRNRHVCCVTHQTCLLCVTGDMSTVSCSRHVCCVTQQTCLLCHPADVSAVSHSRHFCRVTQQTCLLCHTADMSAMAHSRHVCCVAWGMDFQSSFRNCSSVLVAPSFSQMRNCHTFDRSAPSAVPGMTSRVFLECLDGWLVCWFVGWLVAYNQ